jgi:hypothetical protein
LSQLSLAMTRGANGQRVPSRLGVGPVSKNVLDATIRLAHCQRRPVMVIASRRQVDAAEIGAGYLEHWSTERLVRYVRGSDPTGRVVVCRDHGGPWQHPREVAARLSEADAMASSLASLLCDIRSGLRLLHLDTSRNLDGPADVNEAVRRLVSLYGECHEFARSIGRPVAFEVGVEEQGPHVDDPSEFECKLERVIRALHEASLPPPTFVVGQTGTLVAGLANRGVMVHEVRSAQRRIRGLALICRRYGSALKAHNCDYLRARAVRRLVHSGVDAINIAPELGVTETRTLLALTRDLGMTTERDAFMRLAYDSGAWVKWFGDHAATDEQCSVAAGHYVFATREFRDLKERIGRVCRRRRGRTVDEVLGSVLDRTLRRYAGAVWREESVVI